MTVIRENCIDSVIRRDDGSIYVRAKKIEYEKEIYDDGFGNELERLINISELSSTQYYFYNLTEEELTAKLAEIEAE